jgi:hypothetical protein
MLLAMARRKRITIDITDLPSQGGKARAAALSSEELSAAGSRAVNARWEKYYREHPEKLKAKMAKKAKAQN